MAHFIAQAQGQAGPTSRLGSARSGIWTHARGWDVGLATAGLVRGTQDGATDVFQVNLTSGSNGDGGIQPLAEVIRDEATGGWIVELTRPDGSVEQLIYR